MNLQEWIGLNLKYNMGRNKVSNWSLLFRVVTNLFWKWRNVDVFNLDMPFKGDIIFHIQVVMDETKVAQDCDLPVKKHFEKVERLVGWHKPLEGWTKINTNGSCRRENNVMACGGVLRDEAGRFLKVFSCKLGICSVVEVELWGVWHGLNVTWNLGYHRAILEVDSQAVTKLISLQILDFHPLSQLMLNIQQILCRDQSVQILHTWREGNKAVDFCVGMGHHISEDFIEFTNPPQGLNHIIWADMSGVAWPRLCILQLLIFLFFLLLKKKKLMCIVEFVHQWKYNTYKACNIF